MHLSIDSIKKNVSMSGIDFKFKFKQYKYLNLMFLLIAMYYTAVVTLEEGGAERGANYLCFTDHVPTKHLLLGR